eukprot:s289_g6.t1
MSAMKTTVKSLFHFVIYDGGLEPRFGVLLKFYTLNANLELKCNAAIFGDPAPRQVLFCSWTSDARCLASCDNGYLYIFEAGGHVEVVRLLLEAGAEKDCNDRDGITAVMLASAFGRFDVVRMTALMIASQGGHFGVVRLLLEAGAEKDCKDRDGTTALMFPSENGHLDVVSLLLGAGADKDCWEHLELSYKQWELEDDVPRAGRTALMKASEQGHLEVARLLLEAGADKDCWDYGGMTAIMIASESGHTHVASLLVEAGAGRDCWDNCGMTSLMLA